MSLGPVINLAGGYIRSLITGAASGAVTNTASTKTSTLRDNQNTNQLSPFAQVLSSLQQLEQSNLPRYQHVTQQIANNLQTASASATAAGNIALAGRLSQVSTDFRNASSSGQLPNVEDLARAIGVG